MKKLNLVLALTLVIGFTMNAQLFFNTGYDPNTVSYRSYGLQDVAWFVAQTPMNSVPTPPTSSSAYVRAVTQNPVPVGWWNPQAIPTFTDTGWITYPNTCSTIPAYHGCLNDPTQIWRVDQWYKISFYLCCSDFCVNLDMWADNRIQEVYINTTTNSGAGYWQNTASISPFTTDGDYEGFIQSRVVSKKFCSNFKQGLNYMIIRVVSGDPTNPNDFAGLLVHETSRTGCSGITYNVLDDDGTFANRTSSGITATEGTKSLIDKDGIVLSQNVPNPYDDNTVISYTVPEKFNSAQIVFTASDGRIVKTVNLAEKNRGSITVSAAELGTGFYAYSLVVDGVTVETKKMIQK